MEFPKELTDKLAAIAKEHPAPAVKPAPSPLPKEDQSYLDAVDAAMKDPKSANWDTVRALYPDTTFYKRVGGFNIAHHVAATANYVAKRMSPEAIEFYKKFQREHYASAGAHKTALQLHDRLKAEFIDAAAEKAAFDGLMQSVSRTGDGKAPPTAFKVISLEEASEYVMTVMKSAPPPDLKIENADSRRYLVFRGSAVDTGAPLALYFTVDPRATLTPLPQENFPAVATLTVKQAGGNPPASGAQPRQFPDMRGYGGLPDLHDAIARDNQGEGNLLAQVQALSALTLTDIINAPESYDARVDDIIYRWAQTNKLVPNSRGPNVDARQLGVLEKVLNGKTAQLGAASGENPLFFAAIQLNQIYSNVHGHVLATLAIEGAAAKLFLGQVAYNPANDTIGGAQGLDAAKILELGDAIGRMDSSGKKKAAWKTIVGIIEHSIGVKSLSAEDSGALNAVIAKSDSTLSLSKVLAWVTTVDMSQLPGHDYANKSLGLSAADGDLLEVARKALAKDTGKQVVYSDIATEIMKSCCKTQAEVLSYLQDHSYEATLRDMEQSKKDFGSEMNYTSVVYAVWKPSSWQMFRAKYWDKEPLAFKMVIVFMNGDQVVWAYAHVQRS
jgi:hypothetical protein